MLKWKGKVQDLKKRNYQFYAKEYFGETAYVSTVRYFDILAFSKSKRLEISALYEWTAKVIEHYIDNLPPVGKRLIFSLERKNGNIHPIEIKDQMKMAEYLRSYRTVDLNREFDFVLRELDILMEGTYDKPFINRMHIPIDF